MQEKPTSVPAFRSPVEGMPIYLDTRVRSIVDSLDEYPMSEDWYPGNPMALKLWHCLEALRDIDIALECARRQKNLTKRKRQMKLFSVQLHSFATAVTRLCDQIIGDKDARQWLQPGTTKQITKIKNEFLTLVPLDHRSDLSVLRNKMGGHIDSNLSPEIATTILSRQAISSFGKWLHICIHVLVDLVKLDLYFWAVRCIADGCVRIMMCEPFLLTMRVTEDKRQFQAINAIHIPARSPRYAIIDVIKKIITSSQWMFDHGAPRIGSLKVEVSSGWNTFTGSTIIWKGSSFVAES